MSDLNSIVAEARALFESISESAALEEAKAKFLGKSGSITDLLKGLGKLPPEEKKAAGEKINLAKSEIEALLNARREAIAAEKMAAKLRAEALDITLPGRLGQRGGLHPVTLTQKRVEEIFRSI